MPTKDRVPRLEELIKEEVGQILLQELKDPRLGFVSVCRVQVGADMRLARIFVSILKEEEVDETMEALESSRGYVRKLLAERLRVKHTPEIQFVRDQNMAYADKISRLLNSLNDDQPGEAAKNSPVDTPTENEKEPLD